jgi:hypothetical protein
LAKGDFSTICGSRGREQRRILLPKIQFRVDVMGQNQGAVIEVRVGTQKAIGPVQIDCQAVGYRPFLKMRFGHSAACIGCLSGRSIFQQNQQQSAQLGIRRGLAGIDQDAQVVANGVTGSIDAVVGALVDSLQQRLVVEASARMLSTVDRTLGTLVDVKA